MLVVCALFRDWEETLIGYSEVVRGYLDDDEAMGYLDDYEAIGYLDDDEPLVGDAVDDIGALDVEEPVLYEVVLDGAAFVDFEFKI